MKKLMFLMGLLLTLNVQGINVTTCQEITANGTYYLKNDIKNYSGTLYNNACIHINLPDGGHMTLDCQGYMIDGVNVEPSYGIKVVKLGSPYISGQITLKNCVVANWKTGIYVIQSNPSVSLQNITSNYNFKNGIMINQNNKYSVYMDNIETCYNNGSASSDGGLGVLSAKEGTITNVISSHNWGNGISCEGSKDLVVSDINLSGNLGIDASEGYGIYIPLNSSIYNITSVDNVYGLITGASTNSIIHSSIFMNNSLYGIQVGGTGGDNYIYNNIFNNTINHYILVSSYFNTSKQLGDNIYDCSNSYIAGNFWTNSSADGFSDICNDTDWDGFCDENYTLDNSPLTVDYMPISAHFSSTVNITECANLTVPGRTYYLTTNITNAGTQCCINITANDVTFDGQNYLVDGDGITPHGICVLRESETITNVTIKNGVVSDWMGANIFLSKAKTNTIANMTSISSPNNGLELNYSDSNTIIKNNFSSNEYGICLSYSDSVNIIDNDIQSSGEDGVDLTYSDNTLIANSTVSDCGDNGIETWVSESTSIIGLTISNNGDDGIDIAYSGDNIITDVTTDNNTGDGILLWHVNDSSITDLTATDNSYGIRFYSSSSNRVLLADIYSSSYIGITLTHESHLNIFTNMTLHGNPTGMEFISSTSNIVANSTIESCSSYSVYLNATNNTFYNNLFNNTVDVFFGGNGTNDWNTTRHTGVRIYSNGTEIGGNYWTNPYGSGYSDTCVDMNIDGFCDVLYNLSTNNSDYLPLSSKYKISNGSITITPENATQLLDLNCTWVITNNASNTYLVNVSWFINGVINSTFDENNINCTIYTYCGATKLITSNYTEVNENWTCRAAFVIEGNIFYMNDTITILKHHSTTRNAAAIVATAVAGALAAYYLLRRRRS